MFKQRNKKEPPGLPKQKPSKPQTNLTNDIVNQYIQEHPGIVSTYLRNESSMEAQRKQMHVRSLLNNACLKNNLVYQTWRVKRKHKHCESNHAFFLNNLPCQA